MVEVQKNEIPVSEVAKKVCDSLYFHLNLRGLVTLGSPLEPGIFAEMYDPDKYVFCEHAPYYVNFNLEYSKAREGISNLEGIKKRSEEAEGFFYVLGTPNRVKIDRNGTLEDFLFTFPISFVRTRED